MMTRQKFETVFIGQNAANMMPAESLLLGINIAPARKLNLRANDDLGFFGGSTQETEETQEFNFGLALPTKLFMSHISAKNEFRNDKISGFPLSFFVFQAGGAYNAG